MKIKQVLLLILIFLIMTSCATINKEDCKKNMRELGVDHGRKGLINYTDEIRRVCISSSSSVDLESYENGFAFGWSFYCNTYNGYELGRKGNNYKSFCPAEKEENFKEHFLMGKRVSELQERIRDLEEIVQDQRIDSNKDKYSEEEFLKNEKELNLLKQESFKLEQQGRGIQTH